LIRLKARLLADELKQALAPRDQCAGWLAPAVGRAFLRPQRSPQRDLAPLAVAQIGADRGAGELSLAMPSRELPTDPIDNPDATFSSRGRAGAERDYVRDACLLVRLTTN
jgi:hypothetical protein